MNRQQRRREKRKKNPTYNLTAEQIAAIGKSYEDEVLEITDKNIKEESEQIVLKAAAMTLYIPLLVQRDRGFGKKRLTDFAKEIIEQIECVAQHYVTIDEIKQALKDETGFDSKISLDTKNGRIEMEVVE